MSKYIVTGYAGFIGYHLTKRLLEEGHEVVGIDNFNDYYTIELKKYRRDKLEDWGMLGRFKGYNVDVCYPNGLNHTMCPCDAIYHLAAIPGVRNSFENPILYVENNITGSINVLKAAGGYGVGKVILASSSSVYGDEASDSKYRYEEDKYVKCREDYTTDKVLSPYAMSKKAMEMVGYTYHKLYGYDVICPRFFTVYGPAGRPDMAYYIFIQKALAGEAIDVYGDGEQVRDFTYIDDIVDGLVGLLGIEGYDVCNLGSSNPHTLNTMIQFIEQATGVEIKRNYLEPQPGDVKATFSDNYKAEKKLGWTPQWSLEDGIQETVNWFESTEWKEINERDN